MSSRRRQTAANRRNKNQNKTGSPNLGEPAFLLVGIMRRPHGVKGEMQMTVQTDFPERIQPGVKFFLGEEHREVQIETVRTMNKGLILKFKEFNNREELSGLQNNRLYVPVDQVPALPDGEYYQHQLLGLEVITDEGKELGKVVEFIDTGANLVFVVHDENHKEILLPDIEEVILNIDLDTKKITVHIIEGLLLE
ncbi:MAG: 16S rRNA processing protein RimM [Chloroflexi bacterium]|jgi:16S rRNA processing protein RimM|nr:16S rRNA processing protein RimM [Chloroflexota bacterium]MBT3668862.1 16S rRNA processing protein RimM [Chloroflexota bacterium]MBT4002169.1 16S rRNA processing protein RimM [Chloroflexota bacterium]MBT4306576.1 16S rRNA processing protein RimM [Chloroflexota bacterium]MBT4533960.1 16S rRNA processing protein RimM [Chloroflexota bacterium]